MTKAVIDGQGYPWPCGCHVDSEEHGFRNTLMAMETTLDQDGVQWSMPTGTEEELAALRASYEHLEKMRDEVIGMGVIPPVDEWSSVNPNL
jgi:malate dehydrogenase